MGRPMGGRFAAAARLGVFIIVGIVTAASGSPAPAAGDEAPRVLPANFNADLKNQMMRAYLRRQVHAALDRRLKELDAALETTENVRAYQAKRQATLAACFGELPQRTPLHSEITGTIEEAEFSIEKVLFQSQPGFYVTGNVYRPRGDGPFPAILHACGHSENGKAADAYQKANRLLVRHGFLVLCYDPIGQGERKQILDAAGKPIYRASGEHQQLGPGGILVGRSLAAQMLWDGIRCLDYLASRPDVDAGRLGCTGNSGGGNLTSYLMAYDPRVAAAAPGCFITTHRRKNESPGPGDAEQNLFGQIRDGFDHPDFILARAPKPTLILAASKDFVPIEGTWEAFRQAKRLYGRLGFPEQIQLAEAPESHGFSRVLREAAVRFFARWLQSRELLVQEPAEVRVRSDAELRVTRTGQVLDLPGARSLLELYADYERELAVGRPPLTRETLRKVTAVRPLEQLTPVKVTWQTPAAQSEPRKLTLHPEPGIVLPGLFWPSGDRQPVLIAHGEGMASAIADAQRRQAQGHPVLLVDLRATGETKTRNWRFPGAEYYINYMLGRSWLAMWCEDWLAAAKWLASQTKHDSVELVAGGQLSLAAWHAAALEPELIARVSGSEEWASWRSLLTSTAAAKHLHHAVPAALRYYDLPDLKSLSKRQVSTR